MKVQNAIIPLAFNQGVINAKTRVLGEEIVNDLDQFNNAMNTAIKSLEMWEKVKEDINKKAQSLPPNEIGVKTGYLYALTIIHKHLQEVEE